MNRTMKAIAIVLLMLVGVATWGAVTTPGTATGINPTQKVATVSPIDDQWYAIEAEGKTAAAYPYRPSLVQADHRYSMSGFTGCVVRAKYAAAMTVDPVVYAWVLKGDDWCALKTASGAQAITLSDAATDCTDGTSYWTIPSDQIDALGGTWLVVTVGTAATSSGAVSIEVTRF